MAEEKLTLWVRLSGEDKIRAIQMAETEKRPYAGLIRVALAHYYKHHFLPSQNSLTK